MEQKKKRWGDRVDGYLVRDADAMHKFMPHMLPRRSANEAVVNETVDMTAVMAYLAEKNTPLPDFKYTFFHVICAALGKTLALRPKLNRFYAGRRLYQRDRISFSFTCKRQFADHSDEALAIMTLDEQSQESPLEQFYQKVKKFVTKVRTNNQNDSTTDIMTTLVKLPRFLVRFIAWFLGVLNYFNLYPMALMKDDPYYTSVFVSNLGSIKMHADYHHLADWGTNSVFVVINEKKLTPFYRPDGTVDMREAISLSLTLDERIADGYYYAKSIKMLKTILENPHLLDAPISQVDPLLEPYL